MVLNPWEQSCHVTHSCSIGTILQTHPEPAAQLNTAAGAGEALRSVFISWALKRDYDSVRGRVLLEQRLRLLHYRLGKNVETRQRNVRD